VCVRNKRVNKIEVDRFGRWSGTKPNTAVNRSIDYIEIDDGGHQKGKNLSEQQIHALQQEFARHHVVRGVKLVLSDQQKARLANKFALASRMVSIYWRAAKKHYEEHGNWSFAFGKQNNKYPNVYDKGELQRMETTGYVEWFRQQTRDL